MSVSLVRILRGSLISCAPRAAVRFANSPALLQCEFSIDDRITIVAVAVLVNHPRDALDVLITAYELPRPSELRGVGDRHLILEQTGAHHPDPLDVVSAIIQYRKHLGKTGRVRNE